jgi:hypothetical protein
MRRRLRKAALVLVGLALLWMLGEAACLGGLWVLGRFLGRAAAPAGAVLTARQRQILTDLLAGRARYFAFSASLGWTIAPHGVAPHCTANGQGLRGDRDYSPAPPPGRVRIAAFGGSFVHGDQVANDGTWPALMEALDRRVEVMNYGVPAYGLDQSYLRYLAEGDRLAPRIVLVGITSKDLERVVNVFRPFCNPATVLPLAKPRFILAGGRLVLAPNPIARRDDYRELLDRPAAMLDRLGRHDDYYAGWQRRHFRALLPSIRLLSLAFPQDEIAATPPPRPRAALDLELALLDAFWQAAAARGTQPILVLLRTRKEVSGTGAGAIFFSRVLADCARKGRRSIDLADAFRRAAAGGTLAGLIPGHYSRAGNEVAARAILGALSAGGLLAGGAAAR